MNEKFEPIKLDIQFFSNTSDNVLLQDAKTGKIPAEQGMLVLKEFMANSAIAQLAKYEEMTKPVKEFNYLASGPGAYWVGETERIQTSKATWLTAKMETKKLGVIIPVSKEFLKYSVADFFTQMQPAIAEAFYKTFDQATLFGTDSPYATGISVFERITKSGNSVVKGATDNLYTDLNSLLALLEEADHDYNGLTTTKSFKKDLRGALDGDNRPIFNEPTGGTPSSVLGEPVAYVAKSSFDTQKALVLAGDWEMARYGILQGIEYKVSEDATLTTIKDADGADFNLFERDMFALRATMQIGFLTLKEDAFAALTAK